MLKRYGQQIIQEKSYLICGVKVCEEMVIVYEHEILSFV